MQMLILIGVSVHMYKSICIYIVFEKIVASFKCEMTTYNPIQIARYNQYFSFKYLFVRTSFIYLMNIIQIIKYTHSKT